MKKLPTDVFIHENPMGSLLVLQLLMDRHTVFVQVFWGNIRLIVSNQGIVADAGVGLQGKGQLRYSYLI